MLLRWKCTKVLLCIHAFGFTVCEVGICFSSRYSVSGGRSLRYCMHYLVLWSLQIPHVLVQASVDTRSAVLRRTPHAFIFEMSLVHSGKIAS